MKRIVKIVAVAALVALCACGQTSSTTSCRILKVDLDQEAPAMDELFSHTEVVPLTTNDSCLLMSIAKIVSFEDSLYIFDDRQPALYVFGADGRFVRQVSRFGQGPGEYSLLADFAIDRARKEIVLLSPLGYCLIYDMGGSYIRQVQLPAKPNYQSLSILPDGNYVFWSCVEVEEEGITLTDTAGNYLAGFWHNDRIVDFMQLKPFYDYAGHVFFTTAFMNPVYEVSADSLQPSYLWDFGGQNVDARALEPYLEIADPTEKNKRILQALETGSFPFLKEAHYENSRFRYVALRPGVGPDLAWINVFYDKQTDRSFVFEQLKEGFAVSPVAMTNEYLLTVLNYEDFQYMKDVLPADEYAKLTALNEESNPCLLRMYFK